MRRLRSLSVALVRSHMVNYEYLDHTADIQVHAWGKSLEEAFVQCAMAMCNYMFEQSAVEFDQSKTCEFVVEDSSSLNRLLYNFLEEVLYIFSSDSNLAVGDILISQPIHKNESGEYSMAAICLGESYQREKHLSKTEIKAVTYSNMRIIESGPDGLVHIYVIFDI